MILYGNNNRKHVVSREAFCTVHGLLLAKSPEIYSEDIGIWMECPKEGCGTTVFVERGSKLWKFFGRYYKDFNDE